MNPTGNSELRRSRRVDPRLAANAAERDPFDDPVAMRVASGFGQPILRQIR